MLAVIKWISYIMDKFLIADGRNPMQKIVELHMQDPIKLCQIHVVFAGQRN